MRIIAMIIFGILIAFIISCLLYSGSAIYGTGENMSICPKCGDYLEPDDVLMEESNGSMRDCYCSTCRIWVKEN